MPFSFIHAADLHIDSPLAGLGAKDAAVAERFAKAGRKAVENLIEQTIADRAAFLIIAGDLFDGDWKDYSSGLFFVRAIGRLHRAGIPTFIIKGNHDADSLMSRSLEFPQSVHVFGSAKAGTKVLEPLGVAIHGRSFGTRHVPAEFVASYPAARPGLLNIGVLHTSLDGTRGHEAYATCSAEDLGRFGYDYWALGHIHAAAHVSAGHPRIVYPGNVQGRSIRETGPKGAMRVTVEDGRIAEVAPVVLDAARWARANVDVADCADESAIHSRMDAAIAEAHAAADGRPLALRLHLCGTTPLHARIVAMRDALLAEARAIGLSIAEDCWIEQLRIESHAPDRIVRDEPDALDIGGLLDHTAQDQSFEAKLDDLARSIAEKMPRELRDDFLRGQAESLGRIKAAARDHLVGVLASTGAEAR